MSSYRKKRILGGAQISGSYGKFDTQKLLEQQLSDYFSNFLMSSFVTVDIASDYPNVIELCAKYAPRRISYNTKISKRLHLKQDQFEITDQLKMQLELLDTDSFNTVFIHDAIQLECDDIEAITVLLDSIRDSGLSKNIGISVYSTDDMFNAFKKYKFDVVQCPVNIFDQRFLTKEVIAFNKRNQSKLQARSIFLQGLLLRPLDEIPVIFKDYKHYFKSLATECYKLGCTPLEICKSFIDSHETPVLEYVVGFQSTQQLAVFESTRNDISVDFTKFAVSEIELLDPRRWNHSERSKNGSCRS